uniref:SPX domain-containing protein n=1 Tax=Polytomella parva TaxID=51329 RepID=A0A7S0V5U9_9CHLO|mmetsp:Transcript_28616/g.52620  ORF Transcript_28616/g.52620 Transcript_28616/m.52620 type:complete len:835 (+) Transcript_28616:226-2730(+)
MKFGKVLKTTSETLFPELTDLFLRYKELKKQLKEIPPAGQGNASSDASGATANSFESSTGENGEHLMPNLSPEEQLFINTLNEDLQRFNSFFIEKEEDAVIRLQTLSDEVMASTNLESGNADDLHSLKARLIDFHGEMVLLLHWSLLNYAAVVKILKKHDKRTGVLLRSPYIGNVLQQPFSSTTVMSRLVKRAEELVEYTTARAPVAVTSNPSNVEDEALAPALPDNTAATGLSLNHGNVSVHNASDTDIATEGQMKHEFVHTSSDTSDNLSSDNSDVDASLDNSQQLNPSGARDYFNGIPNPLLPHAGGYVRNAAVETLSTLAALGANGVNVDGSLVSSDIPAEIAGIVAAAAAGHVALLESDMRVPRTGPRLRHSSSSLSLSPQGSGQAALPAIGNALVHKRGEVEVGKRGGGQTADEADGGGSELSAKGAGDGVAEGLNASRECGKASARVSLGMVERERGAQEKKVETDGEKEGEREEGKEREREREEEKRPKKEETSQEASCSLSVLEAAREGVDNISNSNSSSSSSSNRSDPNDNGNSKCAIMMMHGNWGMTKDACSAPLLEDEGRREREKHGNVVGTSSSGDSNITSISGSSNSGNNHNRNNVCVSHSNGNACEGNNGDGDPPPRPPPPPPHYVNCTCNSSPGSNSNNNNSNTASGPSSGSGSGSGSGSQRSGACLAEAIILNRTMQALETWRYLSCTATTPSTVLPGIGGTSHGLGGVGGGGGAGVQGHSPENSMPGSLLFNFGSDDSDDDAEEVALKREKKRRIAAEKQGKGIGYEGEKEEEKRREAKRVRLDDGEEAVEDLGVTGGGGGGGGRELKREKQMIEA